jgi:DNA-binding response OmpR family regulator
MNERILVVEGEKNLRSLYRNELQALGYDVITAANGQGALEKLKQEPVDLIVLDLVLPDGIGFDYLEKFITIKRNVKLVIHTAYPSYKGDFHSWVADAFLTKSFDLSELKNTISSVLHST